MSSNHPRPTALVFDVNETLSDMSSMAGRFEDVGVPGLVAKSWFASLLRDGFALAAVGARATFAELAAEQLRSQLHELPPDRGTEESVEHIMEGFTGLDVHPDVADGVRALSELGIRLVTLSNGAASVAETLLGRAGVREHFERLLSVEDAGIWKPAARSYAYALDQCGLEPQDAMLVAVHPWDIDGAARAGLRTAWVDRATGPYPGYFRQPDLRATSLTELADLLR